MPAAAPNPQGQPPSPVLASVVTLSHTSARPFTPRSVTICNRTHWRARPTHQGQPARVSTPAVQRWVFAGARSQPGAGSRVPAARTGPERMAVVAPGSRLPQRDAAAPAPSRWRRYRKTTFPSAPRAARISRRAAYSRPLGAAGRYRRACWVV